jgi:hypothetical protein
MGGEPGGLDNCSLDAEAAATTARPSPAMRATLEACAARARELGEVGRRVLGDRQFARAVRLLEGMPEVRRAATRELAVRRVEVTRPAGPP